MVRKSKQERQAEIAHAALEIIAERGFHKLTTSSLANRVGLAEGTIFRHFENKNAIISAAIHEFEELLFEGFPPEGRNPMHRLRAFVLHRLRVLQEHPKVRAIAFSESLAESSTEEWGLRIRTSLKRSISFIYECLLDARKKNQVAADVPIELLVWFVTGVVRGASFGAPHHAQEDERGSLSHEQIWSSLELLLRRTT